MIETVAVSVPEPSLSSAVTVSTWLVAVSASKLLPTARLTAPVVPSISNRPAALPPVIV